MNRFRAWLAQRIYKSSVIIKADGSMDVDGTTLIMESFPKVHTTKAKGEK